jgi:predicted ATPase/Flp pilus assembly protein TadD
MDFLLNSGYCFSVPTPNIDSTPYNSPTEENPVTQLRTLGELRLGQGAFTQPKPLLLLSYLSLEGRQQRKPLAELFWREGNRMKSLSMALTRLRQGVGNVVEVSETWVAANLSCDAREVLGALDENQWQRASDLYQGAFLEGTVLEDWSSKLEEWVYTTREYLAGRVQEALLGLSEEAARNQDFDKAGAYAERAYKLPGLSGTELTNLKRLYPLLSAGRSLLAPEARKEIEDYGLTVSLSTEEARTSFKPTSAPSLPSLGSSFVGRDEELTELATLLSKPQVSLVTLLGPGGVGKTRLALQLAHEQQKLSSFKDGVYFAKLETLSDPSLLPSSLLNELGLIQQSKVDPFTQLRDFIAQKNLLLVLDNFEHLVQGSSLLSHLLSHCPNLKLFVTSRERLRLEEEFVFTLEGLAYPQTLLEQLPPGDAKLSEAVQLFRERAQHVQPRFDITQNLAEVIRICTLVEGLPLALELAASWLKTMSCQAVAAEIERSPEFLRSSFNTLPERHRSVKAVFDYSWKLLSAKEREVLRKLAVFVGGFRREAASEVAGATIPVLASLVDKSLLRVLPGGRYDRHPLLFQFTREKLSDPNEQRETEQNYRAFYLKLSQQARAHFYSPEAKTWLYRFDEELGNVRSLLAKAESETGLALLTNLAEFWASRGLYQEARTFLTTFLSASTDQSSALYIRGLYTLADFAWEQGDFREAQRLLEQALPLAQTLADDHALSRILVLLARIYHYNHNDVSKARTLYEAAIATAERVNNKANKASALNLMAILVTGEGEFETALGFYQQSLTLWRELGHSHGVAYVLNNLANIYDGRGNYQEARQSFEQSLHLFQELGDREGVGMALGNLASIALKQGDYQEAKELYQKSLALRRELGDKRATAYVLNGLGQVAFQQRDYEGAQTLLQEALDLNVQIGYKLAIGDSLRGLGEVYEAKGDARKARETFQEGLALCRSMNDSWGIANTARLLALLETQAKNVGVARALFEESLHCARQMQSQADTLFALEGFALLETTQANSEKATLLWGFCGRLRQTLGRPLDHLEQQRHEKALKHLRQRLGGKFEAILKAGETMRLEQTLELVQGEGV